MVQGDVLDFAARDTDILSSLSVKLRNSSFQPLSFSPLLKCVPPTSRGLSTCRLGFACPNSVAPSIVLIAKFPGWTVSPAEVPGHALARLQVAYVFLTVGFFFVPTGAA